MRMQTVEMVFRVRGLKASRSEKEFAPVGAWSVVSTVTMRAYWSRRSACVALCNVRHVSSSDLRLHCFCTGRDWGLEESKVDGISLW